MSDCDGCLSGSGSHRPSCYHNHERKMERSADAQTRALRDAAEAQQTAAAHLADSTRSNCHHDIAKGVLIEMVRGRYGASLHTPDVIAENARVALAYADALYPRRST